jgi:wobble nucleotide-excising tRNase
MISKIAEVDNFGIFNAFRWDGSLTEFKKHNIFYGWNYSGKTTLSRIFSNFEFNQKHTDYQSCTSRIEADDGAVYDCNAFGFPYPIRVFNTDFIKNNLKWGSMIEPILMIGEENIQLQNDLADLRTNLEEKQKEIKEISDEAGSADSSLNDQITAKAREFKNTLSVPDYTKRNLDPIIQQVGEKVYILNDETVKRDIDTYRSTDKKPEIEQIHAQIPNLEDIKARASDLLKTKVVVKTIKKLKENPELSSWVRQGKDIHTGKTVCEFCGNDLPADLLNRLNDHFSDEFERHIQEIKGLISQIKNRYLNCRIPDKARFYPEFIEGVIRSGDELQSMITNHQKNLDALKGALDKKLSSPFGKVGFPSLLDTSSIKSSIDLINSNIRKHNEKTLNFEVRKQKAFERLQTHFASEFIVESKYHEIKKLIASLKKIESEKRGELKALERRCIEIELRLSETVKGAERVNEYLQAYIGRNDIELRVTSNDSFQLYRSDKVANNLSEGEKTAISFAYFITKLEEKGSYLTKTIVYLDDPISSLDSNHLFSTYSFIKNKLKDSYQLFISTHNFEFLNLLKDWLTRPKNWKNKSAFYLIERCERGGRYYACLSNMPHEIVDFKSEYHYLFSILYQFHINPVADYNKLYIIPNLARRFLESYLGFKIPKHAGLRSKLPDFMPDDIKKDKVLKFIQQFSHNNSLPRSLMFPDFGECRECISIIMERMKEYDSDHFGYLEAEVQA